MSDTASGVTMRRPDGAAVARVRLHCRRCVDEHPDRQPGLVGIVDFHPERVVTAQARRNGGKGSPISGPGPGRTRFYRLPPKAPLEVECPRCPRSGERVARKAVRAAADAGRAAGRAYV